MIPTSLRTTTRPQSSKWAVALGLMAGVARAQFATVQKSAVLDTAAGGLPLEPREAQGVWLEEKLYVFGGFVNDANGQIWNLMGRRSYVYTPGKESDGNLGLGGWWKELEPMPIPAVTGNSHCGNAGRPSSPGVSAKIWLSGGLAMPPGVTWDDGSISTTYLLEYDVAGNYWTRLADVPYSHGGGGLAYLDGKLHIISGATDVNDYAEKTNGGQAYLFRKHAAIAQDVTTHYVYDVATGEYSPGPSALVSRNHIGVTVFDGKIYVVGGQMMGYEGCTNMRVVEIFDPAKNAWELSDYPLPRGRGHISASVNAVDGRIFITGGKEDHPNRCFGGGLNSEFGYVFEPGKGWAVVDGELGDGASPTCGTVKRSGADNTYGTFCNHPDGVYFMVIKINPYGTMKLVPTLESFDATGYSKIQSYLTDYYWSTYEPAIVGKKSEFVDLSGFCSTFAGSRYEMNLPAMFDAVEGVAATNGGNAAADYAYSWMATYWHGRCSQGTFRNEMTYPSLLAVRRDFEAVVSKVGTSYAALAGALNGGGSAEQICSYGKRELYSSYVAGYLHGEIGNSYVDFQSQAEYVCYSQTNAWMSLTSECERGVGFAAVARCLRNQHGLTVNVQKMPVPGAFASYGSNYKNAVQSCANNYANQARASGKADRQFGVDMALKIFFDSGAKAMPNDASWVAAFAPGMSDATGWTSHWQCPQGQPVIPTVAPPTGSPPTGSPPTATPKPTFDPTPPPAPAPGGQLKGSFRAFLTGPGGYDLGQLTDGTDLSSMLPSGLHDLNRVSISYEPPSGVAVGSVHFEAYNTRITNGAKVFRTENVAPFVAWGDTPTKGYLDAKWENLPYFYITLEVTGYSEQKRKGTVLFTDSVQVTK